MTVWDVVFYPVEAMLGAFTVWTLWRTRHGLDVLDRVCYYTFIVTAWSWLISTLIFGVDWPTPVDAAAGGICMTVMLMFLVRTQRQLTRIRRELNGFLDELPPVRRPTDEEVRRDPERRGEGQG